MENYICIHGHFYQPPRENPWLNEVELQDSAYPYHDWNDRITAECYARNSASRILDGKGRIEKIINNYSLISYNYGPTLLEWMEKKAPDVYEGILQADKDSQKKFSGHGSAMAQAYNHMIMPLANERDRETQVIWGIRDFEKRFGRKPEGMWVGETAVNTSVLEVLAKHGIKFTVLSPYQAKRVKKLDEKEWKDVSGARVDPRRAYVYKLPSGAKINLFFYDGPVSQAIAFEHLLDSGERFAQRLLDGLDKNGKNQLMNIATDGETYGHHHRFGEMGLSYALHHIETNKLAKLTVYGEYLELFPAEYEAEIIEDSSWSCAHGIERWRSDCGCNTGGNNGWKQNWRAPLRKTFDWLRDLLIPLYEKEMLEFTDDPWKVRNEYIDVIGNRETAHVEAFIKNHTKKQLNQADKVKFLKLCEMQYHTMLMYTSCGWFFDEVTGLESMQDIFYAYRALQLAREITGNDLEREFARKLEQVPSNIQQYQNASAAFFRYVKPTALDLLRVGAHYAVSSIFEQYPEVTQVYQYTAESRDYQLLQAGRQKMALGKAVLRSNITWEEMTISFAVLHLGDHHLFGGVRRFVGEEAFQIMTREISDEFYKSNIHEIMYMMDKHFGSHNYSFWHLFRDDQRKIMNEVLENTYQNVQGLFRQVYDNNYSVVQALEGINMSIPKLIKVPIEFVVNARLRDILEEKIVDQRELETTIKEISRLDVEVDTVTLNFIATQTFLKMMQKLEEKKDNVPLMQKIGKTLNLLKTLPITIDLWQPQNIIFSMKKNLYPEFKNKADEGDEKSQKWISIFDDLYESLINS